MSDAHIRTQMIAMPLTKMICDLYSASLVRRMTADPVKTAAHYGVPVETARWWIEEARKCNDVWPIRSKVK